jgi:phage baseplate assembly protein V
MNNGRAMRAMLAPLGRAVSMMVARGVVRLVTDEKARQLLQVEVLKGELRDGVERMQDYGFTSHPLGGDVVLVCTGGSREQAIAIVVDDRRYRIALEPGEVALYDDQGQSVRLMRDGVVHVVATTEAIVEGPTVRIEATTAKINANLEVVGDTKFTGKVEANGKRIDETHKHSGVTAGGAQSGVVA